MKSVTLNLTSNTKRSARITMLQAYSQRLVKASLAHTLDADIASVLDMRFHARTQPSSPRSPSSTRSSRASSPNATLKTRQYPRLEPGDKVGLSPRPSSRPNTAGSGHGERQRGNSSLSWGKTCRASHASEGGESGGWSARGWRWDKLPALSWTASVSVSELGCHGDYAGFLGWTSLGSALVLARSSLYLIGGLGPDGLPSPRVRVFNSEAGGPGGSWREVKQLCRARAYAAAAFVPGAAAPESRTPLAQRLSVKLNAPVTDRLVVAGGVDKKHLCLRAAEVLVTDSEHRAGGSGFWKEIGSMVHARSMVGPDHEARAQPKSR